MNKAIAITGVVLCLSGLIVVRALEQFLFYDPFADYFVTNFQSSPMVSIDSWRYFFSTGLRYLINAVLSLWIIWFIYKKERFIEAGFLVYTIAFIVLFIALFSFYSIEASWSKMLLFYTRRLLIHPIMLFILVAGFYYLKVNKKLS